jgi:glycosyltransferase involved in cell wall biosynthesis
MKKVLMLATTAAMIAQFNKSNIQILEEMGYEIHVVGNFREGNPIPDDKVEEFKSWVEAHHGKWFHIPLTRKPTDLKNFWKTYRLVVNLMKEHRYEFVHCHTPIASVVGRMAAHKTHTRLIYTAHGFHFYKGAPLKNWILYYPIERFLSRWTDVLILINREDYSRALKSFHAGKIEYVPGIGIERNLSDRSSAVREEKRAELGLDEKDIMLLSVGELDDRKNHALVIRAIKQLGDEKIKYFICGKGHLEEQLLTLAKQLGVENQVTLLGFRDDVLALCQATDLYVFPSYREGLAVALMEAISSQTPTICSNIRGNTDLISDSNYLFNPHRLDSLVKCIRYVFDETNRDDVDRSVQVNYENLMIHSVEYVNQCMTKIYKRETGNAEA